MKCDIEIRDFILTLFPQIPQNFDAHFNPVISTFIIKYNKHQCRRLPVLCQFRVIYAYADTEVDKQC